MLQWDSVVMVEVKVLMVMMMVTMIPMKSSAMVMMMAMISPLWEGIFPTYFCLPESFSLLVFSAPQRRQCLSLMPLLDLGFRGRQCTQGGDGSSGPGWPHYRAARPGVDPRHLVVSPSCCSSRLLLLATFIFW
jgi:hypothetical protein